MSSECNSHDFQSIFYFSVSLLKSSYAINAIIYCFHGFMGKPFYIKN